MSSNNKILNESILVDYLVNKFFKEWTDDRKLTGLELEVIPFKRAENGEPFIVPLYHSGRAYSLWKDESGTPSWPGLVEFLKQNEGTCDNMRFAPIDEFTPRFLFDSGAQLTFEPGGQLEYSSVATESIEEVTCSLFNTLNCIEDLLRPYDISFFYGALNPWFKTEEVGLQIRKTRYLAMDRYFNRISRFGQKMMRLTASFQVNLDIGNHETAQKRWLASNLLSPIFMAIFANSPFHEGKNSGAKSFRALIWSKLDPSRTGFQDSFLEEEYCRCPAKQYLQFALNAYCMLPDELGLHEPLITFKQWMEQGFQGHYPDLKDWETHLTTLFPEVRPRGFLEMRYMDTLPKAFYSVPGTLLRRFLYDDNLLDEVIKELEPHRPQLRELSLEAAKTGIDNQLLNQKAKHLFKKILDAPAEGDAQLLSIAETFFKNYTYRDRNPADEMLTLFGGQCPTFDQLRTLADNRFALVESAFSNLLRTYPLEGEQAN